MRGRAFLRCIVRQALLVPFRVLRGRAIGVPNDATPTCATVLLMQAHQALDSTADCRVVFRHVTLRVLREVRSVQWVNYFLVGVGRVVCFRWARAEDGVHLDLAVPIRFRQCGAGVWLRG
jgi:hypothetical protein